MLGHSTMAHVTFIRPPSILPIETFGSNQGAAPLAMAYLISSLKSDGHVVQAIDSFGEAINSFTKIEHTSLLINGLLAEEIVKRVSGDTDYLCITCGYSNEWIYTKEIIKLLRVNYPSIPIILGGEHVTGDWYGVLSAAPTNIICVLGEGESTLNRTIEALQNGDDLQSVAGIAYVDSTGTPVKTIAAARIKSVDKISWPAWDEVPLNNYFEAGLGGSTFNQKSIPMLASRGCPYQCTFCSSAQMWGQKWFPRDVQDLIAEIVHYKSCYNIDHVDFFDLTTIVDKTWITSFCNELIDQKMNITWSMPAGTRSEVLDSKVIDLLKRSGLRKLDFAPESGSDRTLKRIKKQVNLPKMMTSIRYSVSKGIPSGATLIFGFPGQTLKECLDNILFAIKLAWVGLHDLPCFPFVPYPGSELFNDLVAQGEIINRGFDYELFLSKNVYTRLSKMKSWSSHIPSWSLPLFVLGTMSIFYSFQFLFRPIRLYHFVSRILNGKPVTSLELLFYGIKINFKEGRKVSIQSSISIER